MRIIKLITLFSIVLFLSACTTAGPSKQDAFFTDIAAQYHRNSGLSNGQPHHIDFFFSFHDQSNAKKMQTELISKGYKTSITDLTKKWGVMTTTVFPLTGETLKAWENEMKALANKYGGEYSGFGLSEIHFRPAT